MFTDLPIIRSTWWLLRLVTPLGSMALRTWLTLNTCQGKLLANQVHSYNIRIIRLYLEFFRLGVFRTFTYEFIDEFVDPDRTNREANFGLLYRNVTEKPAFFAVKSLIHLLQEKSKLNMSPVNCLSCQSGSESFICWFVHHILLRVHLLTTLLDAPSFTPGELNFNLTAQPVGNITQMHMVHHLLFQKSSGDFYLVFWHEITCEGESVVLLYVLD